MEAITIVNTLVLFIIAIEGALLLYRKEVEPEKEERTSRREVYGSFRDPLGDSYRKNTKGLYVPIHPNSRMLDGSDEEDEI